MQTSMSTAARWENSSTFLEIYPAFPRHSGAYWCEDKEGKKSNTLTITVTAGDVILESPALPVVEGQTVTLSCKKRQSTLNSAADFFKDGLLKETEYKGNMTLYDVSRSSEGLYKCVISGAGESSESWLSVRGEVFQPSISPDRLQFFFYEKINISCEHTMGQTEWRVMQKPFEEVQTNVHIYNQSTSAYKISSALDSHSGTYWCQNADGETSNLVNIIVTTGDVILDVPASPVIEGHDVSLFCLHRRSKTQVVAEFYKDDKPLETAHESKLILRSISKSAEGLYKCSIKAEVSPKSWLSVIKMGNKYHPELQTPDQHVSPSPPQQDSSSPIFLWIVSSATVTVLLLSVLGLFLCQKHKASAEHSDADLQQATYASVKKTWENRVPRCDSDLEINIVTYTQVESFRYEKGSNRSSRRQKHNLMEDGDIYSTIKPH